MFMGKRVWWIIWTEQKLESVGLLLSDDPYVESNSHRFSDDMSLWPRIHIFGYFIKRPGTYTQEQLLSWKQLEPIISSSLAT